MLKYKPERVLFIRFSSIGDILLTSPFLRVFKRYFPDTEVDYLVKQEFADLVRYNGNIRRVYMLDGDKGFNGVRKLKKELKTNRYDIIFDLHSSIRSSYIRKLLGASRVLKVNKEVFRRFILIKTKWNLYNKHTHMVDRYINTAEHFGVLNDGEGLEIHIPDDTLEHVKEILPGDSIGKLRYLAICPSAKHNTKKWPLEYYITLSRKLLNHGNICLLLLGGNEDRTYCEQISQSIGQERIMNLAGKLSLLESAAVMDHCSVVVTNDTGLMHMACARKRKVVAIFGPSVQEFGFFPYGTVNQVLEVHGLACRPCSHIGLPVCPRKHFRCMNEISPDQVYGHTLQFLKS